MREKKEDRYSSLRENLLLDIDFITSRMEKIRGDNANVLKLDIKVMADFHRYSESRKLLVETLSYLDREGLDG